MKDTLVIGVGQTFGADDAVGLVVAVRLGMAGIPAMTVSDGAALVEILAVAKRAIVVDAVVGAGPPGTVIHMTGDTLNQLVTTGPNRRSAAAPVSSHGLSIALAVKIARALGGTGDIHLVGIAIDPPDGMSTSLSEAVADAVPVAVARVQELLRAEMRAAS